MVSLIASQSGAPNKEIAKALFIGEHTFQARRDKPVAGE